MEAGFGLSLAVLCWVFLQTNNFADAIQCYSCKAHSSNEVDANIRCLEQAHLENCDDFYDYYTEVEDQSVLSYEYYYYENEAEEEAKSKKASTPAPGGKRKRRPEREKRQARFGPAAFDDHHRGGDEFDRRQGLRRQEITFSELDELRREDGERHSVPRRISGNNNFPGSDLDVLRNKAAGADGRLQQTPRRSGPAFSTSTERRAGDSDRRQSSRRVGGELFANEDIDQSEVDDDDDDNRREDFVERRKPEDDQKTSPARYTYDENYEEDLEDDDDEEDEVEERGDADADNNSNDDEDNEDAESREYEYYDEYEYVDYEYPATEAPATTTELTTTLVPRKEIGSKVKPTQPRDPEHYCYSATKKDGWESYTVEKGCKKIRFCKEHVENLPEWSNPWNFCCNKARCNAKQVKDKPQRIFGMKCRRTDDCIQGHNTRQVCPSHFKSCPRISTSLIKMECRVKDRTMDSIKNSARYQNAFREKKCYCRKGYFPKGPICTSSSATHQRGYTVSSLLVTVAIFIFTRG